MIEFTLVVQSVVKSTSNLFQLKERERERPPLLYVYVRERGGERAFFLSECIKKRERGGGGGGGGGG